MDFLYLVLAGMAVIASLAPRLSKMAKTNLETRNRYAICIVGAVVGLQQAIAFMIDPNEGIQEFYKAFEAYLPYGIAILIAVAANRFYTQGQSAPELPATVPAPEPVAASPVSNPDLIWMT